MPEINPDDVEVICNVCNLRSFRELCFAEYAHVYLITGDESLALESAVALANSLNED